MTRFTPLLFLAAMFIAGTAHAQYDGSMVLSRPLGVQLTGVALNAAAATRTITVTPAQQWGRVLLTVNYTYSAATTVTITPTCTDNTALTKGSVVAGTLSAGVITDVALSRSWTTGAASANFQWSFDVAGQASCAFVLSGASAGAGDLVTVSASLVVQ